MYVVHPYPGVTSTKGCRVPATFISSESYNLQQKCCHPFLLNLTGSHLGSNSSGIESYRILDRKFYIYIFIFSEGNYDSVHKKI